MAVDNHIKRMMQDLGTAFAQAIGNAPGVGDAVRKIRQEGYSLYLVLDGNDEGERRARMELKTRQPSTKEPSFRLDKPDVSLLKSMGIDPTRSSKRRRAP